MDALRADAQGLQARLEALDVVIPMHVGDNDKALRLGDLHQIIGDALSALGVEVDRRRILMDAPIRTLGEHPVRVRPARQRHRRGAGEGYLRPPARGGGRTRRTCRPTPTNLRTLPPPRRAAPGPIRGAPGVSNPRQPHGGTRPAGYGAPRTAHSVEPGRVGRHLASRIFTVLVGQLAPGKTTAEFFRPFWTSPTANPAPMSAFKRQPAGRRRRGRVSG